MTKRKSKRERAIEAIRNLRERVKKHRRLQKEYYQSLEKLRKREIFNFSLFQYNPLITIAVDREGRVIKSNIAKRKSGDRLPAIGDRMYKDYASKHSIDMRDELMNCIATSTAKTYPEMPYGEKILSIAIAPFPDGAIITTQDITRAKRAELDRLKLIAELRTALNEVEKLRELLPICASCKKIRDDKGYWNQIEDYFSRRGNLNFSHTMCPDCMKELYPEYWTKMAARSSRKG